jgi:hypothetical protein
MLRRIAFTAAALALTSACAVQAAPAAVTPQQASIIEASCTSIMGLRHGEFAYLGCRESLTATAAGLAQGQDRLQAYDACHERGLAAGSAALSTCMLDTEQAAPMQVASTTPTPAAVPPNLAADTSYYSVTHAVQWRREQYACAQLGLVPGSAVFTHCVASLDADVQP